MFFDLKSPSFKYPSIGIIIQNNLQSVNCVLFCTLSSFNFYQSIYIRTVSSKRLMSTFLIHFLKTSLWGVWAEQHAPYRGRSQTTFANFANY